MARQREAHRAPVAEPGDRHALHRQAHGRADAERLPVRPDQHAELRRGADHRERALGRVDPQRGEARPAADDELVAEEAHRAEEVILADEDVGRLALRVGERVALELGVDPGAERPVLDDPAERAVEKVGVVVVERARVIEVVVLEERDRERDRARAVDLEVADAEGLAHRRARRVGDEPGDALGVGGVGAGDAGDADRREQRPLEEIEREFSLLQARRIGGLSCAGREQAREGQGQDRRSWGARDAW